MSQDAGPGPDPQPETWRQRVLAEDRKRRRRPRDQGETLRALTVSAAVAAAGLNTVLFIQVGVAQSGPGDLQTQIVAAISSLFPRAGLQPPAATPSPGSGATPVAVTGGS